MAACPESRVAEITDLQAVPGEQLDELLEEEKLAWQHKLHWDFTASAQLVRRFVGLRSLSGCALWLHGRLAGYSYYVCEESKALIGDLYVRDYAATESNEALLLDSTVAAIQRCPSIHRAESQLLMLRHGVGRGHAFERRFMMMDLARTVFLQPGPAMKRMEVRRWSETWQEPAAKLITECYLGHIDSQINDQYRSVPGARRFLANIIGYPGCGRFFAPASFVALHAETGQMAGLTLASIVAPGVGHITQICVAPWARGSGAGYDLLRHSLEALGNQECREVSLTVTSENRSAIRLYESVGFRTLRRFSAQVWEGWQ